MRSYAIYFCPECYTWRGSFQLEQLLEGKEDKRVFCCPDRHDGFQRFEMVRIEVIPRDLDDADSSELKELAQTIRAKIAE